MFIISLIKFLLKQFQIFNCYKWILIEIYLSLKSSLFESLTKIIKNSEFLNSAQIH